MVLGGSAPSPYLGHSPTSRETQHPAKEPNSVCNLKENSCGRELTVTEEDSQSSLIQLLKKKKEAREMEKAMAEKEEAFRERMKVIADRWRDLHAKRTQLKAHVERSGRAVQVYQMTLSCTTISSPPLGKGVLGLHSCSVETGAVRNRNGREQVIQLHLTQPSFPSLCMCAAGENHQKHEELRIQALKINSKQREEKMKKDGELLRAKAELETLKKNHQKLCKKVQKYSIFKKYLEDVVEVSQFEDISEVTSQYKLLVRTRKDLLQSQQGHKQLSDQDKVLLEQYKAQKEAEMLQYKTELVQLKLRFYQAQSDLPLWEAHWADIQDRTSKKTRKLWTIKLAIHNLFQSTNTQLQAEWDVSECSSCRQLSMIQQFIQRLKDIQFYAGDAEAPEGCYTSEDKRDVAA
ncbi:Coiled-coil domain-containing protein 42A [Lonchura striata]|uniref:Coiled-coil domain-containing protein 42A n=1 Tax=Lonchura striata TaxID=40157 RepID=A0A218V8V1_9PASE|nr:Coiled-coil domain-containing protein 42A [Lonchura striata domestica]